MALRLRELSMRSGILAPTSMRVAMNTVGRARNSFSAL